MSTSRLRCMEFLQRILLEPFSTMAQMRQPKTNTSVFHCTGRMTRDLLGFLSSTAQTLRPGTSTTGLLCTCYRRFAEDMDVGELLDSFSRTVPIRQPRMQPSGHRCT